MKTKTYFILLYFSLLVSVIISTPTFFLFKNSNGYDPALFSDWDEPEYLSLPREALTKTSFERLFQICSGVPCVYTDLNTDIPHAAVDVVVGSLEKSFSLRPITFGTILDLLCLPFAFLIFIVAFYKLSKDTFSAVSAASVTLFFPWVGVLSPVSSLAPNLSQQITTISHSYFPCLPIFRGLYTQVSYPLFALCIFLFFRLFYGKLKSSRDSILLGVCSGLLIYLYFFAWGATLGLVTLSLIFLPLFDKDVTWKLALSRFYKFIVFAAIFSLPGILVLLKQGTLYSPGEANLGVLNLPFSKNWFFSPIEAVLFLATLIFLPKLRKFNFERKLIIYLYVCALFVEHILMNLQPILGRWITPYHFPLFFLHPIMSGLAVLFLFTSLNSLKLKRAFTIIVVVSAVCFSTIKGAKKLKTSEARSDLTSMLEFLDSLPSNTSVAILPFKELKRNGKASLGYFNLPYWIKSLTSKNSFSQQLGYLSERHSYIEREFFLGFLFYSKPQLVGWCPNDLTDLDTTDIMLGTHTFLDHQRLIDCKIASSVQREINSCELVNKYNTDLIGIDKFTFEQNQKWIESFSEELWSSKEQSFYLRKINQRKLITNCS